MTVSVRQNAQPQIRADTTPGGAWPDSQHCVDVERRKRQSPGTSLRRPTMTGITQGNEAGEFRVRFSWKPELGNKLFGPIAVTALEFLERP
jgi:hypothetical protein